MTTILPLRSLSLSGPAVFSQPVPPSSSGASTRGGPPSSARAVDAVPTPISSPTSTSHPDAAARYLDISFLLGHAYSNGRCGSVHRYVHDQLDRKSVV